MFPAYPGFENLPLRVEVEWFGRKRSVVARLEQWPDLEKAALVCQFEDDEHKVEWIVTSDQSPDGWPTSPTLSSVAVSAQVLQNWADFIAEAFNDARQEDNWKIVSRLVHLKQLPDEPRVALWEGGKVEWWSPASLSAFSLDAYPIGLTNEQARQRIFGEWSATNSDARFAWEWANLSDDQRHRQLGLTQNLEDVARAMKLVLVAAGWLWQPGYLMSLGVSPDPDTGELRVSAASLSQHHYSQLEVLQPWQKFFSNWFAPHWSATLFNRHLCIRHYLSRHRWELAEARLADSPSMHEQLEARLQLRDWLRDKAAPAEVERLMRSLDAPV